MNGSLRLAPLRFGSALAASAAVIYLICALAVAWWPEGAIDFFNAWFHGIDLGPLKAGRKPFALAIFVYGLAGVALTAFVGGVLLAAFYNAFDRSGRSGAGSRAATFASVAAIAFSLALFGHDSAIAQSQDARALAAQTSRAGGVTVKVTPTNLAADAQRWQFEVVFDTHSVDLSHDLLKSAALIDAAGRRHAPLAWEGDPPGGHHRKGVLSFDPLKGADEVRLQIRDVGVPEREFRWPLKRQAR